mgnify:CR=1 FL=1
MSRAGSTVAEALALGGRLLPERAGIPDPLREAAWLLASAMGRRRPWLVAHPEAEIPAEAEARYREWLDRRAVGEPAEHLTGWCGFWGRDLEVTPEVLVPRPESELIVQTALALPLPRAARVLDVGTGSGCLAMTLAAERPRWTVAAVDRSLTALEVARRNVHRHRVDVGLVAGDLATAVSPPLDLVVANLPYIPTDRLGELPVEVAREPRGALDGGIDGLAPIRRLLADLHRLLRPCGGAVLELGEDQADAVGAAAREHRLAVARRVRDAGGADRVVVLQPV